MTQSVWTFGVLAFSSLFAMVNPVSSVPMFVAMTSHMPERRKNAAFRSCAAAGMALGLFAVAGGSIFSFFGITVPAFQIAGGLLFTISSIKALQGHEPESHESVADPSVVPLGIPIIAGAGSLSTVMVLAGQARSHAEQAALAGAIIVNIALTLAIFLAAPLIVNRMGHSGTEILSKVMGLITAVIGVQFILNGGTTVVLELAKKLHGA